MTSLFGCPMIINLNNPLSKFFDWCCTFHPVTITTTRNAIVWYISKIVIYSINSIINIFSIMLYFFGIIYLAWLCSTIMTWLLSNPSKEFQVNIPLYISILSIVLCVSIERTKRAFSIKKSSSTPTTFGQSSSQRSSICHLCISTITLAKIHNTITFVLNPFYNFQLTKFLTNHVYKFSHFSSLIGASRSAGRYWCHAIQAKRDAYETKIRQTVFA